MNINLKTLARARLAVREAGANFLFDRNVNLIDFGYPEREGQIIEDELSIRIHVRQKLHGPALEMAAAAGQTRPIPPFIGGFPTDVPQGIYGLHRQWSWGWNGWQPQVNPRANRADPMRGGISISDENHNAYGTLGGLVIDRATGAEMILSNWHVLVASWGARPGQRIYQPGRLDGGDYRNTVATLTRDAMGANLDAAVATLTGERRLINDQLDLGPVRGVAAATLGMEVVKSGRRTGITFGRVTAIEGIAKLSYESVERVIRHVVTIEPRWGIEEVSAPGDSGSVWLDRATMRAVGLHFAGSNWPERGLALDMATVLDALNVDIVTAVTPIERTRAVLGRQMEIVRG